MTTTTTTATTTTAGTTTLTDTGAATATGTGAVRVTLRVVVCESDADVSNLVVHKLLSAGAQVTVCPLPGTALAAVTGGRPDVLVLGSAPRDPAVGDLARQVRTRAAGVGPGVAHAGPAARRRDRAAARRRPTPASLQPPRAPRTGPGAGGDRREGGGGRGVGTAPRPGAGPAGPPGHRAVGLQPDAGGRGRRGARDVPAARAAAPGPSGPRGRGRAASGGLGPVRTRGPQDRQPRSAPATSRKFVVCRSTSSSVDVGHMSAIVWNGVTRMPRLHRARWR